MAKSSGSASRASSGRNYYGYTYNMNGANIYTVDEPGGNRAVFDSRGRVISDGGTVPNKQPSGGNADYNSIHKDRIRAYAAGHGVGFATKKTKKGSGTLFILTSRGRRFTTTSASMAIEFIDKTGSIRR